ncbi:group 3 secretory phospholipase A2 [Bombina bombina]|uniref:group 3 secretory phospholipase A2 n=1 Tax=Bombina bombina TaxID=8345 RepID=UPI00235A6548|nr:group 3 secretory phospholipase A2 [Bombina bombina]
MWAVRMMLGSLLFSFSGLVRGERTHSRYKRGWMMPGTLWCGAGNVAENITNLGVFHGADLCCREHDFCSHQIQAYELKYGIRNYRLHTVSHCDCDQRFRLCLLSLNDTISSLIGIMYFNILEMPCFTLNQEEQCAEWHWWGGCKSFDLLPKAEMQKQAMYNDTHHMKITHSLHKDHYTTNSSTYNTTTLRSSFSERGKNTSKQTFMKKQQQHNKLRKTEKYPNGQKESDNFILCRRDSKKIKRDNQVPQIRDTQMVRTDLLGLLSTVTTTDNPGLSTRDTEAIRRDNQNLQEKTVRDSQNTALNREEEKHRKVRMKEVKRKKKMDILCRRQRISRKVKNDQRFRGNNKD